MRFNVAPYFKFTIMYKYLLLFFTGISFSQVVILKDKFTKDIIPFAVVSNGVLDAYANKNGAVELTCFNSRDVLTFSAVAYKDFNIIKVQVTDVIFLEADLIQLDAIVLDIRKNIVQTKKLKRKGILGGQVITCHYNIITLIEPKKVLLGRQLKQIELNFKKHTGHSKSQKSRYIGFDVMARLNIYARNNNSIGELLYTSNPLSVNAGEKDVLEFDVNNVSFNENGFYLQLEHLGAVNNKGEFVNCDVLHMMRVDIADTKSADYEAISYLPAPVGKVALGESLDYKQVLLPNGAIGNYFLNYRFSYVE